MDQFSIIDSHIHLYPAAENSSLAWMTKDSPLSGQRSVSDYLIATSRSKELKGFIFVETDRKNDLEKGVVDGSGWLGPLLEVDWVKRIALGLPKPGEGHTRDQKQYCLAAVVWAPIPSGPGAMEEYVTKMRIQAGQAAEKIRGFRYLLQGKPKGTMLRDEFIASLKWLGRNNFTFDHCVDFHRDGDCALEETIEMITRAHENSSERDKATFILDHLCKPDMTISHNPQLENHPKFQVWSQAIEKLSKSSKVYIKLSGCFSEVPEGLNLEPDQLLTTILPWLNVVFKAFGSGRIMFGSDWPVCTIERGEHAWTKWVSAVEKLAEVQNLSHRDQRMLFSGTAAQAYGI